MNDTTSAGGRGADLTPSQHRARERSLTQHHAARTRTGGDDIVLKFDDTFLVADAAGDICGAQGRGQGLENEALEEPADQGDVAHSAPHTLSVRRYRTAGDDGLERTTTLRFAPAPSRLDEDRDVFELKPLSRQRRSAEESQPIPSTRWPAARRPGPPAPSPTP